MKKTSVLFICMGSKAAPTGERRDRIMRTNKKVYGGNVNADGNAVHA